MGLEFGLLIGIPNSSSDNMLSEDMSLSEDKSKLGTGDGTGEELGVEFRDGGLGVGGVEIGVYCEAMKDWEGGQQVMINVWKGALQVMTNLVTCV